MHASPSQSISKGQLDREAEDFELEVGSAGLTAPFKVLRQYTELSVRRSRCSVRGGIKEKGVLSDATAEAITLTVVRKVRPEGRSARSRSRKPPHPDGRGATDQARLEVLNPHPI